MKKTAALIPAKSFGRAKSRLGGALGPEERRRLAERCFRGVARAAVEAQVFSEIFVATDGPEVAAIAESQGLHPIMDPPGHDVFHEILDRALRILADKGFERATILMADLPEADADSIRRAAIADSDLILVPDASGYGTSALTLPLPAPFPTAFGNHDSALRHRALAQAHGLPLLIQEIPALARDVDGPLDLARNPPLYRAILAR